MKIDRNNRCCWTLFIIVALFCAAPPLCAQDASTRPVNDLSALVFAQAGDLPIILSAPHGGTGVVPGVTERTGAGLATGPAGFFTGRDTGTEELAREVSDAIKKRFGKSPYVVISKVHRKFMDPNRPADIAFEDPKIQPIYDRYHASLSKYCREVTDRFQVGVLIDLHGQGSRTDTVFRGTKNGLTVTHLRETFGEAAHYGSQSLFGLLSTRGWTVHPSPHDEKEQSGFSGGFIVQSYGSHKALPIDAMQLEFGAEYRMASRRTKTAEVLADALAEYSEQYLQIKAPLVKKTSSSAKPPIKVATLSRGSSQMTLTRAMVTTALPTVAVRLAQVQWLISPTVLASLRSLQASSWQSILSTFSIYVVAIASSSIPFADVWAAYLATKWIVPPDPSDLTVTPIERSLLNANALTRISD